MFTVDDVVVKDAVAEEQSHDDQEPHRAEIERVQGEVVAEIARHRNHHLAEGEHHIQHGALRQVGEVDENRTAALPEEEHRAHAEQDRGERQRGGVRKLILENRCGGEQCLAKQDHRHADDLAAVCLCAVGAQLAEILHADVHEDQRPGNVVHRVVGVPVRPRSLADEVQQKHVEEQENMLPDAVLAVDIDVIGGKVPDLNHRERAQNIRDKRERVNKAVRDVVQQGVVAPDDIHEDQVVYQLDILDLFLFLFQ